MRTFLLVAASAAATLLFATDDARACAVLPASFAQSPSLAVEQALLIHDTAAGQEHFVRQITFRKSGASFGFVVPVPARPEVAKVEKAPFAALGDAFPFDPPAEPAGSGCCALRKMAASATKGVDVLSVQQLGSFTAFVLDASDASGLTTWLAQNHFATPPGTVPWLQHYTQLHFFYVALRFDGVPAPAPATPAAPPSPSDDTVSAETLRISFASPLPYFPYLEPDAPPTPSAPSPRVLGVWMIAREASTPVAVHRDDTAHAAAAGASSWARPWLEGAAATLPRKDLAAKLGEDLAKLLPGDAGDDLIVQTFEDQKTSRHGWGDVVGVPRSSTRARGDATKREAFRTLLAAEALP